MSLELLSRWNSLLGELGELGCALRSAIEHDDVLGAIAATMQLRRTRAAITRVEAPVCLNGDPAERAAIAEVTSLTIGARAAESAMRRWLDRELPGDARLLASPLGIAALADAMLPPVWDFEADVVVLIGGGLEPVAELLASVGQRRIVILGGAPAGEAVVVTSIDEASLAVRMMVPGPPTRMVVRAALGSDPAEVDEAVGKLRNALGDLRIHRNTVRAFSETWVEQGLANLPAIARWPSIAAIGDRFAGVPMVIVAPGPSLAGNIAQLRELRGRAILTAFSHSLKPVLAAGLVPDLVLTVDPQDVRYHFAGCDLSRTCLVNAATVHPALFELPAQRLLTLSANCAIDDWIFDGTGENAVVPGGGSVATTALSLALQWGCDPIVFVGLDLSFTGGAYYVATSSDGATRAEVDASGIVRVEGWSPGFHAMKAAGGPAVARERSVELPGWAGGVVPSSFMFSLFHRWFVERMRAVAGTTVYNCTEGGAFIPGMEHRPLAEVIARLGAPVDPSGEDPRPAGGAVGVPTPRDIAPLVDPSGEDPRPAGGAVGGPTPRDIAPLVDPSGEDPRPAGGAVGGPTPRDIAPLVDVAGALDAAMASADDARRTQLTTHIAGFVRGLRRSRRLAEVARKLIRRGHTGARLAGIERSLAAELRPLAFASLLAQREVDGAHDVARRPGAETDYLAASAALFDTLIAVIDRLAPALAAALDRMALRTDGRAA